MTDFNFSIIIVFIMFSMIAILLLSIKLELTDKAGKVTKYCGKYAFVAYRKPDKVILGNHVVDASDLEILRVRGNSMRDYGILSGNQVYVKPYGEEERNHIDTYPVMVFYIKNHKPWDSIYKLRKFVGYVDLNNVNWNQVYREHEPGRRIKNDEDTFVRKCIEKSQKEEIRGLNRCVLSETYNEDSGEYEYSLHSIGDLYAKVCFVN